MTPLRRNLEQARRDYRADRYPGDLAAELLGAAPADTGDDRLPLDGGPISRGTGGASSRWRALFMPMALSAGIAAAIAVGATLVATGVFGRHDQPNQTPEIATNDNSATSVTAPLTSSSQHATPTKAGTANANTTGTVASSEQSSFSVVPTVASTDESYSSIVPSAPSFDFSLSASESTTTDSAAGSGNASDLRATRTQLN